MSSPPLSASRRPAHQVWLGLLLAIVLGAVSFQSVFARSPNKIVLVAVDLSSSTKTHRADYVKYFRMILDAMGERDVLLVTKITKHPSAGESLAFPSVTYTESSVMTSRAKVKEMNLKRSLEALKLFEALLKDEVEETPVIEVTQNSQRLLQQFKADRTIIVYLSDMMEYSKSTANFESTKPPFSRKLAEAALLKTKKEGRVASLKGVRVYVAGARDTDLERKEAIRWFWAEYFREAGAELQPKDYGTDLVAFDECNSAGSCGSFFRDGREKKLVK